MNSNLIILVLAFVVSGCQMFASMDAGSLEQHGHQTVAAPEPTSVGAVVKAEADSAPVCPSVPAAAECPAVEPVVKAAPDTDTSAIAANKTDVNPVAAESQDTQSQNTQPQEQSDAAVVAADKKPSDPVDSFDIEKYVEQSASCVQQRPCSLNQEEEESPPPPKVLDEPKMGESTKVVEQRKPAVVVNDRKVGTVESGIHRVDRKRSTPIQVEVPPDMPR